MQCGIFHQENRVASREGAKLMRNHEIKAKLRRAAAHLQGRDTRYFSNPGDLDAIRTLYRLADEFTEGGK